VRAEIPSAVRAVQARVDRNPNDTFAWSVMGRWWMRQAQQGDLAAYLEAEKSFRALVALAPGDPAARVLLAESVAAQHRFREALELAQQVLAASPDDTPALAVAGDAQLALGDYEAAEATYRELARGGLAPPVLTRLAQVAELRGELGRAVELARRAARESTGEAADRAWYQVRLGHLYLDHGDVESAVGPCERAVELDASAFTLAALAEVRAAAGDLAGARQLYEQSIGLRADADNLLALAELYEVTGADGQAEAAYAEARSWLEQSPVPSATRRLQSRFYADRGIELEASLSLAEADLATRTDLYAYDTLGWARLRNGRALEALRAFEQALALETPDASLHYHAGLAHLALENSSGARIHLQKALELNPRFSLVDAPRARALLESLKETLH